MSPVAELDGDGELLWRFVYSTRGNVPDLAMRGDTVYRVVSDHLGSILALVRASDGAVRAWWNFDAWGNVLTSSGPGPCLGFAGGLPDSLTGLMKFGARDYDPSLGRWTTKDPLRFEGGINLYAYCAGGPVDLQDPSGRFPFVGETWLDAIGKYTSGKGGSHQVPFSEVDKRKYQPSSFPGFNEAKKVLAPGQSTNVDTELHERIGTLRSLIRPYGRVRYRLTGCLMRGADGTYYFAGYVDVLDDVWDFNVGDGRDIPGEIATWIGSHLPGEPFSYRFKGHRPVEYHGF
ncbi:MAG: hypothetical protein IT347_01790 [Candidatus Eisenbacteria bacterium]|nr:hypothetical protein [Candidatus Eisenbacteria bacterium]